MAFFFNFSSTFCECAAAVGAVNDRWSLNFVSLDVFCLKKNIQSFNHISCVFFLVASARLLWCSLIASLPLRRVFTYKPFKAIDLLSHLSRDLSTKWKEGCNFYRLMIDAFVTTIKRTSIANRSLYYMLQKRKWCSLIILNGIIRFWNGIERANKKTRKNICTNEDIQIKSGILPEKWMNLMIKKKKQIFLKLIAATNRM